MRNPPLTPVLAIDIGGTKVEAALVDTLGVVVPNSRHRAGTGPLATSANLADAVTQVVALTLAALPYESVLLGVGIGCAGPISLLDGAVSPLNLPVWRGFPLRDLVHSLMPGVPVRLRMDGLCITLAEHWVGAARGFDNVMGMVVSTGVGGGLILGGNTVSGPTGNAGHIGHIEVGGFDDPCACGGTGCLEAVASGPRTVAWARAQGWTGHSGEDLGAAYSAGDPVAARAIARSGRALGQAIASATTLLDLDIVTIGGGFAQVTPDLFSFARASIALRTEFDYARRVRVVPSALSGDGPLIGAAALVHRASLVPEA
ncbi:sugar kinase [Cryobacterium roopkundense]|uniref:Glucokinase n=1 Tax=Cryobacterium roopkundense TaxID=1001240 RepID=A0A099JNM7_9MICO|nr:ROK family protein [Cryobacterium roopkundense]KGJ79766.1 sugar kinase [Cryobacterium roopkundense]MBB5640254.1 glucokinase [Cryobacterium roopkundense]